MNQIDNTLSFASTFNQISTSNDLNLDIRKLYKLVKTSNISIDRINGFNKLTIDSEKKKIQVRKNKKALVIYVIDTLYHFLNIVYLL